MNTFDFSQEDDEVKGLTHGNYGAPPQHSFRPISPHFLQHHVPSIKKTHGTHGTCRSQIIGNSSANSDFKPPPPPPPPAALISVFCGKRKRVKKQRKQIKQTKMASKKYKKYRRQTKKQNNK